MPIPVVIIVFTSLISLILTFFVIMKKEGVTMSILEASKSFMEKLAAEEREKEKERLASDD